MVAASEPVDARADRSAQAVVAVVLLGAFVFHQPGLVPVLALVLGAGAAFGPAGNLFHRAYAGLVAPRASPAATREPATTIRAQDALMTALLSVASLAMWVGLGGGAWVIALGTAFVGAIAATTGVHLGVVVRDRLRRR